jgi:hypothetical protein
MHPREAFKIGFLARCVEQGLSPEDTRALAKSASDCFEKAGFSGFKDVLDTAKGIGYPALAAAAAAPIALGGGAAYFANKATDTDATDIEEIKQKELVDTYRRMADQLRRQRKMRDYKAERKRTGQVFL